MKKYNISTNLIRVIKNLYDHCETRKGYYCPRSFRKMPNKRMRDTEQMDRILH